MSQIDLAKEYVKDSNSIVFFGGAGVSTDSGIPDFRSATGLYNQKSDTDYSPEYMLSHEFLLDHPEEFTRYYKEQLIVADAKPNDCHKILAELEKEGRLKAVITQNIDSLHQMAGSKNVIELHGNLRDYYCMSCGKEMAMEEVMKEEGINYCPSCGGVIRPDIVLYGESLKAGNINAAVEAIATCDVFIIGGTSLVVYPAAGMVQYYRGDKLILINEQETPYDSRANCVLHENLSRVFREIFPEEAEKIK